MTRYEITAWSLTALFVGGMVSFAIFSDNPFFRGGIGDWRDPAYVPERNPAVSCGDSRNVKLPYCVERKAKTDGDWQSMSRHQDGKTNAFSLRNE